MVALAAMGVDVATFGNHEFDGGYAEAIRLIYGDGPIADAAKAAQGIGKKKAKAGNAAALGARAGWPGSSFPWVSANVVDAKTKKPVLPPYAIKTLDGVKVAFVGAVTKDLKNVTSAKGIPNIVATDPAKAVNALVPELRAKGVKTIVVVVHEGGHADKDVPEGVAGPIVQLAKDLDPEVDVVMSGHSHQEYATTIAGKQVVQAGNYAKALAVVELDVNRRTGDVVRSASRLVRNDERGIKPDPVVGGLVRAFEAKVAPRTQKVVGQLDAPLTRESSAAGESALGTFIADAQRAYAKADVGLMNRGGVRADLQQGPVTWGQLFSVQPFGNRVNTIELTGAELRAVLEEQFTDARTQVLQSSGITTHVDMTKPVGSRIVSVTMADGTPLDPAKTYKVAVNGFLIDGGDGFTTFKAGKKRADLGDDLAALVAHFARGAKPPTGAPGRIVIDAGALPTDKH